MKKTLFSIMSLFFAGAAFAQVEDISVTAAPTVGYTWWDNSTAIKDGVMVGGQLGFGFGRGIELRGTFSQSVDLKSRISEVTNDQNVIDNFKSRDVKVTRWGGEFKANIPTGGWLAPYFTLGSGVQTLRVEKDDKQEQIYATAGLGTKFNLGNRMTFNVEGKVSAFNMDSSNVLYDRSGGGNNNSINQWINDNVSESNMINWSLMAGLQFYLGGRTPEEMNAIESAYDREFGGGLRSFKFVLEPSIAYINFDDDTNMRDTYLVGGSAGFDFTEFVGVRGFYYQSTKDKKISTEGDKMAIYGGDFLARLNVARGVVPYITVGGGYMNVYDSYVGKDDVKGGQSGYFAKGGIGISIPLGKYVEAFGATNMLLTTDSSDPANLQNNLKSPEELRKSVMYNAGLRLKLGAPADGDDALSSYVDRKADRRLESKNKRIAELEEELKKAYKNNDSDRAVEIIQEKRELERRERGFRDDDKVRMTPEQLQKLVNQVVNDVEDKQAKTQSTDQRIDRLERLLLEANTTRQPSYQATEKQSGSKDVNQQILEELKKLNDKVDENSLGMDAVNKDAKATDKTVIITGANTTTPSMNVSEEVASTTTETENNVTNDKGVAKSVFYYKGTSVFTGVNFGGATVGVLGVRGHYGFTNSIVEFAPDLMLGFGSETAYGVNANVLFPFNIEKGVVTKPYIGVGLGLNSISGDFRFGPNLILGTSFNVLNGQLYVDYTSRNLFDNNQIAVGYRFGF